MAKSKELIEYCYVELNVTNLKESLYFWTEIIGLEIIEQKVDSAQLGIGEKVLIVIHENASKPYENGYTDMYHLAIHVPNISEFAKILMRFIEKRVPFSPVDHIMSKALYLTDRDNLTIEITLETPENFSKYNMEYGRFQVIDSKGNIRGATEPLDIEAVLENLNDDKSSKTLPLETKIGHVHLYVNDLQKNYDFYKSLGFIENLISEEIGFADMSAGGIFKHRIAMNIWQSKDAPHSPKGNAGMKSFRIKYADYKKMEKIISNLDAKKTEEGYELPDPSGNIVIVNQ